MRVGMDKKVRMEEMEMEGIEEMEMVKMKKMEMDGIEKMEIEEREEMEVEEGTKMETELIGNHGMNYEWILCQLLESATSKTS
ncbi:hypothetical protein Tco_0738291 [Tanacetum coccineum]